MRKTNVAAALFVTAVAAAPAGALAGPNEDAVMNADRAFNAMAQQKGVAAAFGAFAAPNAVIFEQQPEPERGPQAIFKFTQEEFSDGGKLAWAPKEATASRDGSMGTTWGRWTFSDKDEKGQAVTITGSYLTVWQKQADGSWKYTHDMIQNDQLDEPKQPQAPKPPGH
jgi:ketosteroid isomerase-like protein